MVNIEQIMNEKIKDGQRIIDDVKCPDTTCSERGHYVKCYVQYGEYKCANYMKLYRERGNQEY